MRQTRDIHGSVLDRPRRVFPFGRAVPSGLANIWEWWEPSREAYTDGEPMPVLHGQLNSRHWTQITASYYPTMKHGILNGLAVSRHVLGATPQAWTGPSMTALTAAHIFIIVKINNDPPATSTKSGLWWLGTSGNASHYPFTDSSIYDDSFSTVRKTVGNPAPALTSWRLYEVISTSSEWTAKLDGTQIFTTATNTPGFRGTDCVLGNNSAGHALEGDIAGCYLFSAKMGAERADLITYVNSRFAQSFS